MHIISFDYILSPHNIKGTKFRFSWFEGAKLTFFTFCDYFYLPLINFLSWRLSNTQEQVKTHIVKSVTIIFNLVSFEMSQLKKKAPDWIFVIWEQNCLHLAYYLLIFGPEENFTPQNRSKRIPVYQFISYMTLDSYYRCLSAI